MSPINLNDKYFYTFKSSSGSSVRVLRGDGPPKMTGGGGGFEVEARPRRVGLTLWKGREPYRMDIPILFDGFGDRHSVESDIATLNQMQMGQDLAEPPHITILGAVPVKGIAWVITIEWGDEVFWEQINGFYRTRQDAVVHCVQYNPQSLLRVRAARPVPNSYVTKKGETLRSVAKQMYGDASQWTKIQAANPSVRDPNNVKDKTRLRIP